MISAVFAICCDSHFSFSVACNVIPIGCHQSFQICDFVYMCLYIYMCVYMHSSLDVVCALRVK